MFEPQRIKELRLKMLQTQEEFAKTLGVSFASVNRYENGKSIPTIRVKRKLLVLFKKNGMGEKTND